MPRITDDILDCVIYLYPSELDARNGERVGGSGEQIGDLRVALANKARFDMYKRSIQWVKSDIANSSATNETENNLKREGL